MNALERLRAVLCAPDGEVVINGTDADRSIVAEALKELDAALSRTAGMPDRKTLFEQAEVLAACYRLKELVEGVGCERWQNANGFRLKDTKQWVEFYNVVNRMQRLEYPPAAAPAASGGDEPDPLVIAKELATSIWSAHYREDSPNWEPFDNLAYVLSQISNMVSGMTRVMEPPSAASVSERARAILSQAYRDAGFDKAAEWVLQVDLDNELYVLDRAVIRALEQALTQQRRNEGSLEALRDAIRDAMATTTPQPSADAVRELVAEWKVRPGVTDAYKICADELESLLSAASGEKGVG